MEIFNHNSNIHFLRIRVFSVGVAIVLMIASAALIATKGLNYALDFTGGVSLVVDYAQPVQTSDVHDALEKAGLENPVVQSVGGSREVSIRMQPTKEMLDAKGQVNLDKVASTVMEALKASRNDATLKSRFSVSAEVGAELKSDGMVAAVFVILGIMAYLWIRFERRFAIAAVLTEIHDTLVTLGVLALVQREFDMTVLASVLAVIGYSINDKVVVFDRVRELFRLTRKAETPQILNRAINNTLSRTIITSVFTAITMASLWLFGGTAVHGFAITMLIGILVGTLSSIFFASPLLLWFGVSKTDLMPVTKENPELARRP